MLRLCACFVFVLACVVSTSNGAKRVDVKHVLQQAWRKSRGIPDKVTSFRYKRDAGRMTKRELDDAIALDDDTELQVVSSVTTVQGTRLTKLQETFKGRPVADGIVTLETDRDGEHVLDVSGTVYTHIDLDLDPSSYLDPQQALAACMRYNNDQSVAEDVSHTKAELEVLFDEHENPIPAYITQYLVLGKGEERRPTCILDARDAHVIFSWDALDSCWDCTAKGTGGNLKIGKIHYGRLQQCLNLRREDDICYLENKYVRVLNNNFTKDEAGNEEQDREVASYDCLEIDDEVNGAYSPLLDALFYGTVVGRMYEDWYNIAPLGETITFRVHYGVNVSNAFWNGYECQFGDGDDEYFPMISLDIVSHEVAHGVTEKNSNLFYFHQWGGIDEAFSDMAGETAEAYLNEADWVIGIDISKTNTPLRYFEYPEMDNASISHVDNYTDFLDPHLSSGVFNRVFYLLVHEYGLPIKDVFHVFLQANQMYWHHMSSYILAACDVMKTAYDLGQDGSKFRKAFSEVGVDTCDLQDHVLGLRRGEIRENITVSKHISPFFLFGVPGEFATNVTIRASSLQGEVYIIAANKTWGGAEDEEYVEVYAEGLSIVQFQLPTNTSTHVSLRLYTDSEIPLTDVVLEPAIDCVEDYIPNKEVENSCYIYCLWKEYCSNAEEEADQNEENPCGEDCEVEEDEDEPEDTPNGDDNDQEEVDNDEDEMSKVDIEIEHEHEIDIEIEHENEIDIKIEPENEIDIEIEHENEIDIDDDVFLGFELDLR